MVLGGMIRAFSVVFTRLLEWQFSHHSEFEAGAEENAVESVPLPAPRGVVYDRYGVGLALNAPAFKVAVVPALLPDEEDQALHVLNRLSALIDVPATRASADAAGKKGIRSLDDALAGKRGLLTQVVDVAGLPVRTLKRDEPVAGRNVKLTIDAELQKFAEQALTAKINNLNAAAGATVTNSGVVIVMKPKTGEILATVSWPTYDNSRFARNIDADYYFRVLDLPQSPF